MYTLYLHTQNCATNQHLLLQHITPYYVFIFLYIRFYYILLQYKQN